MLRNLALLYLRGIETFFFCGARNTNYDDRRCVRVGGLCVYIGMEGYDYINNALTTLIDDGRTIVSALFGGVYCAGVCVLLYRAYV